MIRSENKKYWLIWILGTLGLVAFFTTTLLKGDDKTIFMPGPMTGGHHQIGVACDSCHKKAFTEQEDFQESCIECHGEQREKPFDSHPSNKFADPRNASLLETINAQQCVTCHTEHLPEITHKQGYTQPKDFCVHCHAEIGEERPSHKGMDFMTCNDSGCHNFHNNRALYTDFLTKHINDSDNLEKQVLMQRDFAARLEEIATYPHDAFPVKKLSFEDIDTQALDAARNSDDDSIMDDWLATKHAQSGVGCNACHINKTEDEKQIEVWKNKPNQEVCSTCHEIETKHFQEGKHGMRLKVGLSPMTPDQARLPMHKDSMSKELNCSTCHAAHRFDVKQAAVESCLTCHVDDHSLAYESSPHAELWEKEKRGELPEGSGVSCASCHMPRIEMDVSEWLERVVVMHNQNYNLIPNEKMLRPTCLKCHGLEFSINALSDKELVRKNFNGVSSFKTQSLKLAEEEQKRHEEKMKKKKQKQ